MKPVAQHIPTQQFVDRMNTESPNGFILTDKRVVPYLFKKISGTNRYTMVNVLTRETRTITLYENGKTMPKQKFNRALSALRYPTLVTLLSLTTPMFLYRLSWYNDKSYKKLIKNVCTEQKHLMKDMFPFIDEPYRAYWLDQPQFVFGKRVTEAELPDDQLDPDLLKKLNTSLR